MAMLRSAGGLDLEGQCHRIALAERALLDLRRLFFLIEQAATAMYAIARLRAGDLQ
jgi:hypothetical protein